MGRPSKKTPEVVQEILQRLSHGETYKKICSDDHMPDYSTVWDWEQKDEEFAKLSARAREIGTHHLADECIDIADNATDDVLFLTTEDASGHGAKPAIKHSAIQRARLQIDTRMRLIGKWNAKNYGDKVQQEHTGNVSVTWPLGKTPLDE